MIPSMVFIWNYIEALITEVILKTKDTINLVLFDGNNTGTVYKANPQLSKAEPEINSKLIDSFVNPEDVKYTQYVLMPVSSGPKSDLFLKQCCCFRYNII